MFGKFSRGTNSSELARFLDRSLRMVCALAVAIVTMFHVCDTAAGRVIDVVPAVSGAADSGPQADVIVVEKCHLCVVVSLPAILTSDNDLKVAGTIPLGSTLQVTPFRQSALGPPPRP